MQVLHVDPASMTLPLITLHTNGSARAVHQCQTLEDAIRAVHKKLQASTAQPPQHQQGLTKVQLPAGVVQKHQQHHAKRTATCDQTRPALW
jgi:hypothetical protein